jgi:thiamine-phosphate pyrophosphorylase
MNLPGAESMVRSIVDAHRDRISLPVEQPVDERSMVSAGVYGCAKVAALKLGFIDADAECIGRAWDAQTLRTGAFSPAAWPDAPLDFGISRSDPGDGFAPCPLSLGLYAVLPDAAWVQRLARASVPTVQLRFKSTDVEAVRREVQAAVVAVRGTHTRLFINDHWQAAIEAGAYGVHLGQEDLDAADMKAIRRAGLSLGISTHGYAEMLRADLFRPSYIAIGAVYATTLKPMPTAPQGPGRLAAYARLMRGRSLVAIGGIDLQRLPEVLASGVGSVAVVRALVGAVRPEEAAAHWMTAIQEIIDSRPPDPFSNRP